jgi:predicted glutamine amidotransferase
MCRILGCSYGPDGPGAEDWTPSELAQIMFPALVGQGPHAYGYMTWEGGSNVHVFKAAGRCDTKKALGTMDLSPHSKWFVGHTRWATHGSPENLLNNHPIRHGNIVGVHNGVIRNYRDVLAETGRWDSDAEVDSEAIFAAVNRFGKKPGLNRIQGDMVTVWADLRKMDTLYIAKSHGRPLVLARTAAGSLLWASEEQALDATGIELFDYTELGNDRMLEIREGKIIRRTQLKVSSRQQWGATSTGRVGVRGITDHFEQAAKAQGGNATSPPKGRKTNGRAPVSSDSWGTRRQAHEIRRGSLDDVRAAAAKRGIVDGTCVDGLYYYRGLLVTENEYIEMLRQEMDADGKMDW